MESDDRDQALATRARKQNLRKCPWCRNWKPVNSIIRLFGASHLAVCEICEERNATHTIPKCGHCICKVCWDGIQNLEN